MRIYETDDPRIWHIVQEEFPKKKPYAVITWVDMNCQTTVYSSKECSTLLTFTPVRSTVEYL